MNTELPRLIRVAQHGATVEQAGDEVVCRGLAARASIGAQSPEPADGPSESAQARGTNTYSDCGAPSPKAPTGSQGPVSGTPAPSDPAVSCPPCEAAGTCRPVAGLPPQRQGGAFERNVATFQRLPYDLRAALAERFERMVLTRC